MDTFKITRISQTYWIEAISTAGVSRPVEAWSSKEAALARVKVLQNPAVEVALPTAPKRDR
jgi:hypothetical protein